MPSRLHPKYILRSSDGTQYNAHNENEKDFIIRQWENKGKSGVIYKISTLAGANPFREVDDAGETG